LFREFKLLKKFNLLKQAEKDDNVQEFPFTGHGNPDNNLESPCVSFRESGYD
jgi:hypothetical protein